MLSKADKKWIVETIDQQFDRKFDEKFDQKFDEKFDEKFEELRHFVWDSIATFKDEILSVLHPLQEDHTVLGQHVSEHTDLLEQHEIRLTLLETPKKSHQTN